MQKELIKSDSSKRRNPSHAPERWKSSQYEASQLQEQLLKLKMGTPNWQQTVGELQSDPSASE